MPSDIEIAQAAKLQRITSVAKEKLGIGEEHLEPYGHYKAKVSLKYLESLKGRKDGKLVLVTAISPTPAGEGKTTTTVGLGDALNHIGRKAVICLREPSLGPVFGMKGGAAGGGRAQVVPMEDINLHFTGDFGAIQLANNLLAALIDNNCRAQPRGFFETIFGIEPRRGEIDSTLPELDPDERDPSDGGARQGGPYTVCVRSCDGYFFPLANSPGGREGQDEMCQSLCPGTETLAFGMSSGGDIQNAVARSTGQPYSSLPNALKYTRSFDAACTCRAPGQSWAQVLQHAEQMLDQRKGDIIVTEQRSLEMSRPKPEQPQRGKKGANTTAEAKPTAPPASAPTTLQAAPGDEPAADTNVPTAGTESAGVGPQRIDGEKTLQQGDGLKRESKSITGERRTVRIVAPNLAPNLGVGATARP